MPSVPATKMSLPQLVASRKLWRAREVYRYRKMVANVGGARAKWSLLYGIAKDTRRTRDRQIAKARKGAAHEVSDAGVALVAAFEGFRANAYHDAVGVLTQGYGETQGVTPGKSWTEAYAKSRLKRRLNDDYLPAVLAATKGKGDQNVVDGNTSFVYNVGTGGVAATTTVGKLLRAGKFAAAADALLAWSKAGGRVLLGLLRRRQSERALIRKTNH